MAINSSNVYVYPSGYRQYTTTNGNDSTTTVVNVESRLNTEYNITNSIKALASDETNKKAGSFVINYDSINHTMEFMLSGYHFIIKSFTETGPCWASLELVDRSTGNYSHLVELAPYKNLNVANTDKDLDDNATFIGLNVSSSAPTPQGTNIICSLQLLDNNNSVPKESYWKYQFKDIKTVLNEDLGITNTQKTLFTNGNNEIEINNKVNEKGIKLSSNGNYIQLDEVNNKIKAYGNAIEFSTGAYNFIAFDYNDSGIYMQGYSPNGYGFTAYGTSMYLLDCDIEIDADSLIISSGSKIEINTDTEFSNDVEVDEDLKVYGSASVSGDVSFANDTVRFYSDSTYNYRMLISLSGTSFDYNTVDGLTVDIGNKNIYFTSGQQVRYALVGGNTTYIYGVQTEINNYNGAIRLIGKPVGNSNHVKLTIDPEDGEIIDDDYYTGDIKIQRNGENPISLFGLDTRIKDLENKHLHLHSIYLHNSSVGVAQDTLDCRFTIFNTSVALMSYDDIKSYVANIDSIPATGFIGYSRHYGQVYGLKVSSNKLQVEYIDYYGETTRTEIPFANTYIVDNHIQIF